MGERKKHGIAEEDGEDGEGMQAVGGAQEGIGPAEEAEEASGVGHPVVAKHGEHHVGVELLGEVGGTEEELPVMVVAEDGRDLARRPLVELRMRGGAERSGVLEAEAKAKGSES